MPRYTAEKDARTVKYVWIHGREIANIALACDTDEGWVDIFAKYDGHYIAIDGEPLIERLYGDVEVILENGEPGENNG